MIKLAKYLKPFLLGLLAAIVLLFVQAFSELNLPNYMSDIVNVGIQQNGIESGAPSAISTAGYDFITSFMSQEELAFVRAHYKQVELSDLDDKGKTYASSYPAAAAAIYVRTSSDQAALSQLESHFGVATWTMIKVLQDLPEDMPMSSATAGRSDAPDDASTTDVSRDLLNQDISSLYPMQPWLSQIPAAVIANAREQALKNDASMLKQSATVLAKSYYNELGVDLAAMQRAYILRIGLFMLGIALIGGVATVLVSLISSRIAAAVARNLRRDVFNKVRNFSNREFDQFSTASLITRSTNDVTQIQMLLMMGIRMIFYAPIMAVGGVFMALDKSTSMSWIIVVAVVLLVGLIIVVMTIALPKFTLIQKLIDRLNLVSRENLSGLMVIRAFGTRAHEKMRFESANDDLTRTNLFINRVMVFMMPVMMLIMNGVGILIVWVGAGQISNATMQIGDMMAFIQYSMQIIMAFFMISMMFIFVPRAAVSGKRIAEVLESENSIVDPLHPKEFAEDSQGLLEFRNVNFRYHDAEEDSLHEISFTARPGQTTALIGSTGSGKSTVVNLLMRFYDVTAGQILVDGVDIREVRQKDLRNKISYVPQKGVLFSGSIASNIRYGKNDATDEEVVEAARIAQATEFIEEKTDAFDAEISQGGSNVSGGQKQRLAIARALIRKPEIYIFDDSFSALDFKTDAALRRALKEQTGESTVLIVGQRVSTIMHAEQIIVLDDGRIVGRGTHAELLKSCPPYYEIAATQLTQEELA